MATPLPCPAYDYTVLCFTLNKVKYLNNYIVFFAVATYHQYICKIRLPSVISGKQVNVDFNNGMFTSALFVHSAKNMILSDPTVSENGKKLSEIGGIEFGDPPYIPPSCLMHFCSLN